MIWQNNSRSTYQPLKALEKASWDYFAKPLFFRVKNELSHFKNGNYKRMWKTVAVI